MVTAQEYLDNNYPHEKRKEIKKLNISRKELTDSLDCSDFSNLEELDCLRNKLTNLNLTNCHKLTEVHCYDNNLTTLTISNQESLEYLDCSFNSNLSNLIVINNPCLTSLDCSNCNLTTFTLTNNSKLAILSCSNNHLTNFNCCLTNCHNEESLTKLNISNNNLTGDLAALVSFTKLERFTLSNNNLTGSLQSLQKLTNLQELNIYNTNVTADLEHLPESLKTIYCTGELVEILAPYKHKNGYYDYSKWREDNKFLLAKTQLLIDKERQLELLKAELETSETDKKELQERLTNLQTKYDELLEQVNNRQQLLQELGNKKKELGELIESCNFNKKDKTLIKILLETQENITLYNTHSDHERKEDIIECLKEEFLQVDNLCQLQTDITIIDKELDSIRAKGQSIIEELITLTKGQFLLRNKQQLTILCGDINIDNSVNIKQGNYLKDNVIGDKVNLSYNLAEITNENELLTTHIEQSN